MITDPSSLHVPHLGTLDVRAAPRTYKALYKCSHNFLYCICLGYFSGPGRAVVRRATCVCVCVSW